MKKFGKHLIVAAVVVLVLCITLLPKETQATTVDTLTLTLRDDDRDGWNGNRLLLYVDGVFVESYTMSGSSKTYTIEYSNTSLYEFKWGLGSYASECSFDIVLNGTNIFSASEADCGAYTEGQTVFSYEPTATAVYSGKCGANLTWALYDNGTLVISGTGDMYDFNYSPSVSPWEKYSSKITKVIIRDGVTNIGCNAFFQCDEITSVSIPDSVVAIKSWAFGYCSSLKAIDIPDSVTSIGVSAFNKCTSLDKLVFPKGLTKIQNSTFWGCTSLQSVVIPSSVTKIGGYAFCECTALKEVVFLGNAPTFDGAVFQDDTVNVYFNCQKEGWTDDIQKNYNGTVTWCDGPTLNGDGSQYYPYSIWSESDLKRIALFVENGMSTVGKHFKLSTTITLSQAWTPIGTAENPFRGTLEGNKRSIYDMTASGEYSALFAYIGGGANIKNLWICDPAIQGESYVAGIAAYADTTKGNISIENCHLSGGSVNGNNGEYGKYTAGIVAFVSTNENNYRISIANCTVDSAISGDDYMGGIVGIGRNADIRDCENYQTIDSGNNTSWVGGILGAAYNCTVTRCANFGAVSGNAYSEDNGSSYLGGISGYSSNTTFTSCINYGNVSAFFVGGISGGLQTSGCQYINCLNIGTLMHSSDGHGYAIAYPGNSVFMDCYYYSGCFYSNYGYGHSATNATAVSIPDLNSGRVTYLLQSTREEQTWGQKLDSETEADLYPMLSHDIVYKVVNCVGSTIGYANTAEEGIHKWVTATCGAVTCTYCRQTQENAMGHNYTPVVTNPTCTEKGFTTYTCACGDTYVTNYIDAVEHSYNDGVETQAPTCKDVGIKTFTCTVCGDSYTEEIEKLTTHSYNNGIVTKPATCAEAGIKTYTCTVCGDSYAEEIAKLETHNYNSGIVTSVATCKDAGIKTFTCTICGDSYTEEIAKLTTHSYDDGVETKAPTCAEAGVKTFTCTICGDSYTEEIAKLTTHSYDDGVETKAPTCAEAGIKTFTCTICGDSYTEEIAKLTTHSYDDGVETKAPTCAEAGIKTYTCTVCGDSYAEEIAKLTTHNYADGTCTVCGGSDPDYVPPVDNPDPSEPTEPSEPSQPSEPTEPDAPTSVDPFTALIQAIIAFFKWLFGIK